MSKSGEWPDPEGLPRRNNGEPFYVKGDEYSLSGCRFQGEQVRSYSTLRSGRGVFGYICWTVVWEGMIFTTFMMKEHDFSMLMNV